MVGHYWLPFLIFPGLSSYPFIFVFFMGKPSPDSHLGPRTKRTVLFFWLFFFHSGKAFHLWCFSTVISIFMDDHQFISFDNDFGVFRNRHQNLEMENALLLLCDGACSYVGYQGKLPPIFSAVITNFG